MHVTSKMCMTKDVGVNNNLFGGHMMAWVDEAAAIYAHTVAGERKMVTLKFSEMIFHKPIKVGDILEFDCEIVKKGKTSVTIKVDVLHEGELMFSTEGVFVAVDAEGHSKTIWW